MIRVNARSFFFIFLCAAAICSCNARVEVTPTGKGPLSGENIVAIGDISPENPNAEVARFISALDSQPVFTLGKNDKTEYIIKGRISNQLEDVEGTDLVQVEQRTGKWKTKTKSDPFVKKTFEYSEPEYEKIMKEVPFIQRNAQMTFFFSVYNKSGEMVVPPDSLTVEFNEKYGGLNEISGSGTRLSDLPGKENTYDVLADKLAGDLIQRLLPHSIKYVGYLDAGESVFGEEEISEGVRLAQEGKWDEAVEVWQALLKKYPHHPSANYNIGVAHERLGDEKNLKIALDYFTRAVKEGDDPIYRDALNRGVYMLKQLGEKN